jgi:hypothetical protein
MLFMPDDCIIIIIQFMKIQEVIQFSLTNTRINKLCNNFESIKYRINELPFNPHNVIKYNCERSIKEYINYTKYILIFYKKSNSCMPLYIKFSDNILPPNIIDSYTLKYKSNPYLLDWTSLHTYCLKEYIDYHNIFLVVKTNKLLENSVLKYYRFIYGGTQIQSTTIDEYPILCDIHNIKIRNEIKIKNNIYKYKIPIVFGISSKNSIQPISPYTEKQLEITLSRPNGDVLLHDIYIKAIHVKYDCQELYVKPSYSNLIIPYKYSTSNFTNGSNQIVLRPTYYPIKIYFTFQSNNSNGENSKVCFDKLQLSMNGHIINYKYNHIKTMKINNIKYFYLNFYDDSINICNCLYNGYVISKNTHILFEGCNVDDATDISVYGLIYNNLLWANGLIGTRYSN